MESSIESIPYLIYRSLITFALTSFNFTTIEPITFDISIASSNKILICFLSNSNPSLKRQIQYLTSLEDFKATS